MCSATLNVLTNNQLQRILEAYNAHWSIVLPGKEIKLEGGERKKRRGVVRAIDSTSLTQDPMAPGMTPSAFPYEEIKTLAALPEEPLGMIKAWWYGKRPLSQAADILRKYGYKMKRPYLLNECEATWGQFATEDVEVEEYRIAPEEQIVSLSMRKLMNVLRRFEESTSDIQSFTMIAKIVQSLVMAKIGIEKMKMMKEAGIIQSP